MYDDICVSPIYVFLYIWFRGCDHGPIGNHIRQPLDRDPWTWCCPCFLLFGDFGVRLQKSSNGGSAGPSFLLRLERRTYRFAFWLGEGQQASVDIAFSLLGRGEDTATYVHTSQLYTATHAHMSDCWKQRLGSLYHRNDVSGCIDGLDIYFIQDATQR